ncbi:MULTISPECIES: type II toxin-antitoxin system VapC family toxin [Pseudanabaena]|uniref:type II toxin-antitoxin system VapC family toxin n=1 Tax=Pseudanabaena TaxID=1152 RepID=UPI00247A4F3F|nr:MULTISPECIES: type II toxin-antitoxin system VapC family toxin [Pseudanabaena]MEA5487202.1 type II toxin-antitoxin system VapC family toxin [Pseudanabaena sp. CCNP1317]WGS70421.1 type II toxin-antitoxin system VapC family toxin [Pseudanabaena galeata CCNP1313]
MSEIIVLDTHIWLWLINSNFDQFPSSWLERFEAEILAVSPLSCYEIALAQSRGRLELTCSSREWFSRALAPAKIELLPLTPEITTRAVNLMPIHKDPFDRLIIATALEYGAKLASVDSLFSKYPELENYLM